MGIGALHIAGDLDHPATLLLEPRFRRPNQFGADRTGSISASGSTARWTAPNTAGTYTIDVTAMDGEDEANAAFRFTVK